MPSSLISKQVQLMTQDDITTNVANFPLHYFVSRKCEESDTPSIEVLTCFDKAKGILDN